MNTLTIPFAGASSNVESKEVVIDTQDLVTLQQTSDTSTILYVSNANAGTITLTHSTATNGAVGNAINNAILKSNQGNTIVTLPTNVEVTAVAYN